MAEATNHAAHPEGDEDLKRAVIENLDALDRNQREAGQYRKLFEATTNPRYLSRFVGARAWQEIAP